MIKRVLFVGMSPNPGGIETYIMNIFNKLQGDGFSFDFVNTFNKPIAYSKFIRNKGGHIYKAVIVKHGIKRYLTRYHIAKRFFKIHHDYDIVHINALSVNEVYWAKAARKYGIRHIIFQSHNAGMPHYSKIISFFGRFMSLYNKLYLKRHPQIVKLAASDNCGKWMFGDKIHFTVINNGINTDYFKPNYSQRINLKKKMGLSNDKVIIETARLAQQKNYPKIIRIFKHIHNELPNTKLIIIGTGGEWCNLKKLIESLRITQDVIFLGTKSKRNISKLLNIGDLMLMPSLYEAVPFSLTEAQSIGIPAIVSRYRIPYSANITNMVYYLSLAKSDSYWAKVALKILKKPFNFNMRLNMNNKLKQSKFNVNKSITRLENIYLIL